MVVRCMEKLGGTRLRGGMRGQREAWREWRAYMEWKGLQARAGQALLKVHKPKEAASPTFDDIDLDI